MNWTHYRTLVNYLTELRDTQPDRFDYGQGWSLDEPGCVDCACRVLMDRSGYLLGYHGESIGIFLEISQGDSEWLWSPGPYDTQKGLPGITRALEKLAQLAARYGGEPAQPTAAVQTSNFTPDEAASELDERDRALIHCLLQASVGR